MKMIEVKNLTKVFKKPFRGSGLKGMIKTLFSRKYEEIRAVDNISFEIQEGEIVGYIGANGAGKSTTIKMMSGILHPTSGDVVVDGININNISTISNSSIYLLFSVNNPPQITIFHSSKVITFHRSRSCHFFYPLGRYNLFIIIVSFI